MENFEILEQALKERGETLPLDQVRVHSKNPWPEDAGAPEECSHKDITLDKNITICVDCGEELEGGPPFDKEWRYYGGNDNRYSADPNRCQIRKIGERSIYKDIEGMNLSEKIVSLANELYSQVTGGEIHRGTRRKGIIFACVQQAYKLSEKPQIFDVLIIPFNIKRKAALKGIKYVNTRIPPHFRQCNSYITPVELLQTIMKMFEAKQAQIQEVLDLYPMIKDKSVTLNGSRPRSLASGLVFYWIDKKKKLINIKDFSLKVELSELTVKKIFLEIKRVLDRPPAN